MAGAVLSRRRVLAGLLLLPPAVAGCALGRAAGPAEPDPLIALADAARADAALAAAAVAADPNLAAALQPLVEARTQHAAALDAEIARLNPQRPTPAPAPPPSSRPGRPEVQRAVLASGRAAADVALGLPPERVGLVASVAVCCNTYAEVLT
ncbi:hypothetical protein [Pseudonocardia cypriaca]|uniref:DUF4439 domain-containing protein n=1 Tax=Pseudonocardia cypriaca TaxID=882449 RepID=A0A543GE04_9PSEU|nr:hypothetical protein [Pseudonocardia cypriaca]TQM44287.1 hypothetical protein FB388_1650 [Pseudonocardia cypriaca]